MSRLAWLRLPWLFNRRVGVALLWTLLVVAAAVAVNIAGIHVVGGVEGWQHWLQAHAGHSWITMATNGSANTPLATRMLQMPLLTTQATRVR